MLATAIDNQVLEPYPLHVVATDHRKHSRSLGRITDSAIGIQWAIQRNNRSIATDDSRHGDVEAIRPFAPDRHTRTDFEASGLFERDLFLSKVAVDCER